MIAKQNGFATKVLFLVGIYGVFFVRGNDDETIATEVLLQQLARGMTV